MSPYEHLVNRLHERKNDAIAIRSNLAQQRYSPTVNYELYERTERTTTITRIPIYNADDELVRIEALHKLIVKHSVDEHNSCFSCGLVRGRSYCLTIELLAVSEGWTR
jgi:hypothetical protein